MTSQSCFPQLFIFWAVGQIRRAKVGLLFNIVDVFIDRCGKAKTLSGASMEIWSCWNTGIFPNTRLCSAACQPPTAGGILAASRSQSIRTATAKLIIIKRMVTLLQLTINLHPQFNSIKDLFAGLQRAALTCPQHVEENKISWNKCSSYHSSTAAGLSLWPRPSVRTLCGQCAGTDSTPINGGV